MDNVADHLPGRAWPEFLRRSIVRNNHQEIEIAAGAFNTAGRRAEEIVPYGAEEFHQPKGYLL